MIQVATYKMLKATENFKLSALKVDTVAYKRFQQL